VGGQVDFVRGASHSLGGMSVIALPSTARGGTLSRIVPGLLPGTSVTTSRNDVDYVVTEYGTAELRGKSVLQRIKSLIMVAHPDFRENLEREAALLYG
jgi:4-hydroxybutyrate CoA-transferase